ncbi:MAG: GNAT family N-acetyltransferase, partial [Alphaproteobacteria bacterium]
MSERTQGWRPMTVDDIPAAKAVADAVHTNQPERTEVFADRLRLQPAGCRVLEAGGSLAAYILSHPWRLGAPPALDTVLERLPEAPDTYYIHDIALLPAARGTGAAAAVVEDIAEAAQAAGFSSLSRGARQRTEGLVGRPGGRPPAAPLGHQARG